MTTATMSRTDALTKLRELEQEASELQTKFDDDFAQIADQMDEVVAALKTPGNGMNGHTAAAPARRGPKPKNVSVPTAKAKPGRKPGRPANAPAAGGKVAPNQRNYSNEMSLPEAVFDVLNRPRDWSKAVADLPPKPQGLQIQQIKAVILHEKKWVSSASDISPQLQSIIGKMKESGAVARGDNRSYYIPRGATIELFRKHGKK